MREPVREIGEPLSESESATARRFKAVGRWLTQPEYDPERGTRADDFNVATPDYVKRLAVSKEVKDENAIEIPGLGGKFIPHEVSGIFMQPVRESRRWKPVTIHNAAELESFSGRNFLRVLGRKRSLHVVRLSRVRYCCV